MTDYGREIFSIGMTMLSAGMLRDFGFLYDMKKVSFDYEQFDKILD